MIPNEYKEMIFTPYAEAGEDMSCFRTVFPKNQKVKKGEMWMEQKLITIIGSYNVGLFLKGQKIPSVGETVIGDIFYEGGGGKGSNQAIAASLLGAKAYFIGRIGNDRYGKDWRKTISLYTLKEHFRKLGQLKIISHKKFL